ncbi:hypothetical protein [Halobacillus seohaensis]|uniref:Uncharacterized protein n=1 Tax=Halobacillus seohaensis TaxID=447421 RepID=A0ABW2EEA9_9BACI
MNDLLELIFSNFLIVAAIIGGLISWFSSMNKKETEKQNRPNQPKPTATPSGQRNQRPQVPEKELARGGEVASKTNNRVDDYYEQKQKRLDDLQDYQANRDQKSLTFDENTDSDPNELEVFVQEGSNKKNSSIVYSNKWSRSRLADGIIMSEILGQPRAYKPHSSHPRKR